MQHFGISQPKFLTSVKYAAVATLDDLVLKVASILIQVLG